MNNKIFKHKKIFLLIFVLFFISSLFFGIKFLQSPASPNGVLLQSDIKEDWNKYVNETYGFSVEFPKNWKIYEDFSGLSPIINIYYPESKMGLPFDHFANYNSVSIFPSGIETETVLGQTVKSNIKNNFEKYIGDKKDYIFENGDVWATKIDLKIKNNQYWKPWSFIWIKNKITDEKFECKTGDKKIDLDSCNPFEGDEIVRTGKIDLEKRKVLEEIIASFQFLNK